MLASPSTQLRPLGMADIGAVMAIEARCYSHPWTRGNFTDSLAAGYIATASVLATDELVGYCIAMPGVDELHLLNITVAPRWQRQGIATQLLLALHQEALRRAMPTLWLEVRASNTGARAMYARHGYTDAALRRAYYPAARGLREDAVVMRCNLTAAGAALPHLESATQQAQQGARHGLV